VNQKKIVFCVNTEYQLLISLLLYFRLYSSPSYICTFILIKKGNRFCNTHNLPFESIEIEDVFDGHFSRRKFYEIKRRINNKFNRVEIAYFFLDNVFINTYLIGTLKKRCAKIYLADEGLSAYNKITFLDNLRRLLKYIYINMFFLKEIQFISQWGENKNVDLIYLRFPDYFHYKKNTIPIKKFSLDFEASELNSARQIFFKNSYMMTITNSVVIVTQPLFEIKYKSKAEGILKKIVERYTTYGKKIYIKLHPAEDKNDYERLFKKNINVTFLEQGIPFELISVNIQKTLIISWSSAALLFNTPTNKYFWLYKLVTPHENYTNPTSYIKVIQSLNDLFKISDKND